MLSVPPAVMEPQGERRGAGRTGVHQVKGHRHDLALEASRTRTHVPLQSVHVREEGEGFVEDGVVLRVAAVHRSGALASLPEGFLLAGRLPQLAQDPSRERPSGGKTAFVP